MPGDRLCSQREACAGSGTYVKGGHVFASATGCLQLDTIPDAALDGNGSNSNNKAGKTVSVQATLASSSVLRVGQVVLTRVRRVVALQQIVVEIVAAEGVGTLPHPHEGGIRKEDIRSGPSEEVNLHESFCAGDFVLCKVLSLGDARRYLLTTAEPELGVVRAKSATSGKPMVPVSWKEMECPETGMKEPRKCAKPTTDLQTLMSAR